MPVAANKELEEKLTALGQDAVRDTGIEIAEVQVRGVGKARLVRVYIDKPEGVTHGDCELISTRMGELLDQQDAVSDDSYTLEVSSLGVERKLSKLRDFERVVGKKVLVSVKEALPGAHQFEGKLVAVSESKLEIETGPNQHVQIALDQVQRAKLRFDW